MTLDWSQCPAVDRDPLRMGGKWCFKGTRLAVESLFEHIEDECTIDEFVEWFPSVTKEQVREVLEFAKQSLQQPVAAA